MKTIQFGRDFALNFYPDSTMQPEIIHEVEGFHGVYISYENAKEMIVALQNFVDTVDAAKRKQEANDQISMSMGYL